MRRRVAASSSLIASLAWFARSIVLRTSGSGVLRRGSLQLFEQLFGLLLKRFFGFLVLSSLLSGELLPNGGFL